ncbi:MAG: AAA family ATPase [Caldilineaceae bacterium]
MLKLPYGIRDFDKLISEKYYYFDRTDRIHLMERLGYELLFLRPRRMGKSLWLSTLINYYDINKADDFDRLFGQLAIGRNPTPLHNQYLVLKWDFSNIESYGTIEQIRQSLYNHINSHIKNFQLFYGARLSHPIDINPTDALATFDSLLGVVRNSGYKLYLFIDEYDNFANEVMMAPRRGALHENHQRYQDLVAGEGLLKTLFKNIKSAGAGEGLDRVFMTGVTPIVMNDMTSGANTTEDISWAAELNDLCGFRTEEVVDLVAQLADEQGITNAKQSEILELMRIYYDGSWFMDIAEAGPSGEHAGIYNPTLVFYFLKYFQRRSHYPREMLDNNLAPDYHKLVYISTHPQGEQLLLDAVSDVQTVSVTSLSERFGMAAMLEPAKQRDRLAVLLCYLGALTVRGTTPDAEVALEIPNLVMRKLYAERILEMIFPAPAERDAAQDAARKLFAQGDIQPLCEFIEHTYLAVYDNRDYKLFNELTLKTLFLALLQHNLLYIMDSEPALQRSYADLSLLIRPEMRHFSVYDLLLEFKYTALDRVRAGKQRVSGQEVRQMAREEVAALDGVKEKISEAETQLRAYRQILQKKYDNALKLRTYAVVGVGVERLIWQEITM